VAAKLTGILPLTAVNVSRETFPSIRHCGQGLRPLSEIPSSPLVNAGLTRKLIRRKSMSFVIRPLLRLNVDREGRPHGVAPTVRILFAGIASDSVMQSIVSCETFQQFVIAGSTRNLTRRKSMSFVIAGLTRNLTRMESMSFVIAGSTHNLIQKHSHHSNSPTVLFECFPQRATTHTVIFDRFPQRTTTNPTCWVGHPYASILVDRHIVWLRDVINCFT
jgi:hypothetical protein